MNSLVLTAPPKRGRRLLTTVLEQFGELRCKLSGVMCCAGLECVVGFNGDRRDCDGWIEGDKFAVRVSG